MKSFQESEARQRLQMIPMEDSVWTTELSGSWLANRKELYRLETSLKERDSDRIVLKCPRWVVFQESQADLFEKMSCVGREKLSFAWKAGSWVVYRGDLL